MRRYVNQEDLEQISDGKIYDEEDMVKADCMDCSGCSKCCRGMGNTITLDPYDVWRLTRGTGLPLEALLADQVELNVVDGVILPNLRMTGEKEQCAFLDSNGRCGVHAYRPGICRLYPLGRYYEGDTLRYFLQTGECTHPKTKIRVRKWIDTPDYKNNKEFILCWHDLVKQIEGLIGENGDDEFRKDLNIQFLKTFYLTPYQTKADSEETVSTDIIFYRQFYERKKRFQAAL